LRRYPTEFPLPSAAPAVTATLVLPANFDTTVAMWVMMTQTSTAAAQTQWVLTSEYLSIGVSGNSYVVSMNIGCTCTPCDSYRTVSSEAMRVTEDQWVHLAVSWAYDAGTQGNMVMVFVDGVLVESTIWPDVRSPIFEAKSVEFVLGQSFNGLIFDLHVNPGSQVTPSAVKEGVQCPWHYPNSLGQTVAVDIAAGAVRLVEGVGPAAKAGAVTGTAGHWMAVGEDSAGTVPAQVTLEGTGLIDGRSGETGRFVITSRAGCGRGWQILLATS
jgi:hypothetical protein